MPDGFVALTGQRAARIEEGCAAGHRLAVGAFVGEVNHVGSNSHTWLPK